jgi:hypothetical protein
LGLLASGGKALACILCHSATAMGVRHQLFEHDFMSNAAGVAAPVPILLAAILWLAREPRTGTRGAADER